MAGWRGPVLVSGTDTGVGKTVVTAAIAAAAAAGGLSVVMLKPAQTGADDDAGEVHRLAGVPARAMVRYPDPLAPAIAAEQRGMPPITLMAVVSEVNAAAADHDLVLVEGAGGLLVPLGSGGWTIADLATALDAPTVIVARAGLGTLNHVALTMEAAATRQLRTALVIGDWPRRPELVHQTNRTVLPPPAGVVPERAADLPVAAFRTGASRWLGPLLHGQNSEFC